VVTTQTVFIQSKPTGIVTVKHMMDYVMCIVEADGVGFIHDC